MKVLDRGRLHISAVSCGMAQRILDEAVAYAKERRQLGKRIGEFQRLQRCFADAGHMCSIASSSAVRSPPIS